MGIIYVIYNKNLDGSVMGCAYREKWYNKEDRDQRMRELQEKFPNYLIVADKIKGT